MSGPGGRVGVLGAGTMGLGIAQAAALAGWDVTLVEPVEAARGAAGERFAGELARGAARGRWSEDDAARAGARVALDADLGAFAACDLVVEAIPEQLELKREALARVERAVRPETVLATNTSSLPVAAIAATLERPGRLVGMHFFNPAAILPLVEVVPSHRSDPDAVERVHAAAAAWGKTTVLASDTPGFVVNRCARPLYGEPDRLLLEGVAEPAHVDELFRAAGFRMGPFELIDLIGLEDPRDSRRAFRQLASGEPRWRPAIRQTALVAAGRLGRKTGAGFHDYPAAAPRERIALADAAPLGGRLVAVHGTSALARQLRARLTTAGVTIALDGPGVEADVHVDADARRAPARAGLQLVLCWSSSLALQRLLGAVGFSVVPPLVAEPAVELTRGPATRAEDLQLAAAVFAAAGLRSTEVGDGPGLVVARVVAQLVNEACFAVQEGVASADDVDTAIELALGHPRGPFAWGAALGLDAVLALLDGAHAETGDDRYRAAPLLRRAVANGVRDLRAPSTEAEAAPVAATGGVR